MKKENRTCYGCKHLHVTYDRMSPWGCRVHGFKSKLMPCVIVESVAGTGCAAFEKRLHSTDRADIKSNKINN